MESMRVLLVDDEEELVYTLVERLELRDIEATAALTGTEALALMREKDFDVVVLDVRLRGEDGIEILAQMKEIQSTIPIILLSGHTCEETSDKGLDAGAIDFVCKPVDINELIEKMREGVELSRLGSGGKR